MESARTKGLLGVGRELAPLVGPRTAAEIAMRVKRGLSNPNAPGGLTKDHGYLSGLRVLERLDADSIGLLRSVRWPIGALPALRARRAAGSLIGPSMHAKAHLLLPTSGSPTV